MPNPDGSATAAEIEFLKSRSGGGIPAPFQNQPKLGGRPRTTLAGLLGGGGGGIGGIGQGPGGGGGGTGPGGNLPNQINTRYQGQRSPIMDEIQNRFRTNYARGEQLFNEIPDFKGQEAKIRSNQSVMNREAMQLAGQRGGMGLTPAQMADMQRRGNEAVTQSARDWHDAAIGHQANMFGQLTGANTAAGNLENQQLGNINDQIRLQQSANQLGFQAWLEQAKLPIAAAQAQNSGTAAILGALFPYLQMANKNQNQNWLV